MNRWEHVRAILIGLSLILLSLSVIYIAESLEAIGERLLKLERPK